jgi:hypothetical protein
MRQLMAFSRDQAEWRRGGGRSTPSATHATGAALSKGYPLLFTTEPEE